MISVVIPTLNAQAALPATLEALVPGVIEGHVRELIIVDGGSSDATLKIADAVGATVIETRPSRGHQLGQGAVAARSDWLLFLHADTCLAAGWEAEAERFMSRAAREHRPPAAEPSSPRDAKNIREAAAFRFALDDDGWVPRLWEMNVAFRCSAFGLPYGDQGLLISRDLYDAIGGFADIPLMEDVDIVRKVGRRRLRILKTAAVTSAERFHRAGYLRRSLKNMALVAAFRCGVSPERLARWYA